ncbi:hypothetical protein POX_d04910 [Penicillium oxalicum]|uniref:Uncharacterized protein n=1 Tax=Penicillium oxalicum (strain 114-2 / CGMCC 5302) TaxID=933388 RepID=S7ZQD7_PENO1|nr:hypothetical protein POX_d04910 [Penicillium oxalicum]EPS32940.1 hypothetical protein PDE_07901 [Penicillium oxalicum 114-2]KAI2789422.1 hypothetical protein POX_d04910 [Penicillium oxalicum]
MVEDLSRVRIKALACLSYVLPPCISVGTSHVMLGIADLGNKKSELNCDPGHVKEYLVRLAVWSRYSHGGDAE